MNIKLLSILMLIVSVSTVSAKETIRQKAMLPFGEPIEVPIGFTKEEAENALSKGSPLQKLSSVVWTKTFIFSTPEVIVLHYEFKNSSFVGGIQNSDDMIGPLLVMTIIPTVVGYIFSLLFCIWATKGDAVSNQKFFFAFSSVLLITFAQILFFAFSGKEVPVVNEINRLSLIKVIFEQTGPIVFIGLLYSYFANFIKLKNKKIEENKKREKQKEMELYLRNRDSFRGETTYA